MTDRKSLANCEKVETEKSENVRTCSRKGILLVPKPSTDPRDPLNWPDWRKHFLFAILCFATFMGIGSSTASVLANTAQSETFNKSPQEVSWTSSGLIGGLILGPLIFVPAARLVGMCSVCFWTLVANTAFSVWAGAASGRNDFISYALARGLSGLVCAIPQTLTGGYIINVYFRHERGKMFAIYSTIFVVSTVVASSFCGFIVQHSTWPVNFWWLAGGNGLAAILVLLFLEETVYDRSDNQPLDGRQVVGKKLPRSWIANRWVTFFPGHQVVPPMGLRNLLTYITSAFAIGLSPVTILAGLYACINFAWWVTLTIELPIVLAQPFMPFESLVGYNFDAQQIAIFFISLWVGVLIAQFWGIAFNDRVPLYLTRRRGSFAPEYRLYPAWVTGFLITPAGLGLFGASLQYHLHFMVLAIASALAGFGTIASVPVALNYIVESFPQYPQEVGAALNAYRLVLSLAIPFFYQQWVDKVGIGWVFGMQAFLSIFAFLLVLILMIRGPQIRTLNLLKSDYREENLETESDDGIKK